MDKDPTLTEQLRNHAHAKRDAFNPHWDDEARRLMIWAANSLEAADVVIKEKLGVGK